MAFGTGKRDGLDPHFFQVAEIESEIEIEDICNTSGITQLPSDINIRFQIDPGAREIEPFCLQNRSEVEVWGVCRRGVSGYC